MLRVTPMKGKPTTKPDRDKLNVKASEDGKTLTIKLAYPCSYFDKIVAFGTMSPVQKATVEKNGDKWATKPETYVCNGLHDLRVDSRREDHMQEEPQL